MGFVGDVNFSEVDNIHERFTIQQLTMLRLLKMLIIISVADAIKERLGDLKESFPRRFVFLRSVFAADAELTDAKMLEIFELYQKI